MSYTVVLYCCNVFTFVTNLIIIIIIILVSLPTLMAFLRLMSLTNTVERLGRDSTELSQKVFGWAGGAVAQILHAG
jgi:hypothetical protein